MTTIQPGTRVAVTAEGSLFEGAEGRVVGPIDNPNEPEWYVHFDDGTGTSFTESGLMAKEPAAPMRPTSRLIVDAKALRRTIGSVLPFASDDYTFRVICSVHLVGNDGTLTGTATDRYTVGRNTVPCEGTLPATLLERDDAKSLRRFLKGISGGVTVIRAETTLTVTTPGYSLTVPVLDATFPKNLDGLFDSWHNERSADGVALNPRLLTRFAKVKGGWDAPMRTWFYGSRKAVHVRIGDEFAGMLMPVNVGDDDALTVPSHPVAAVAS